MGIEHLPAALQESIKRVNNNANGASGSYKCIYTLTEEGKEPIKVEGACFSGLASHIVGNSLDPRKVVLHYLPLPSVLKPQVRVRWIELCQTVGVLPKEQTPADIIEKGFKVFLGDDDLSPFMLYTQLSFVRYMFESPRLVENVLDLVDEGGADFWAAFVFSHDLNCNNGGHSIVQTKTVYYKSAPGRGHLGLALAMHRTVRKSHVPDDRVVWQTIKEVRGLPWGIHTNVLNPAQGISNEVAEIEHILDPRFIPLFQSESTEEFLERLENLKEENPHVKVK